LPTREYYDDFDLTVDFKQLANGNSGVFFRSFIEPGAIINGWQVEVAPQGWIPVEFMSRMVEMACSNSR
jgi:hypothetical protein